MIKSYHKFDVENGYHKRNLEMWKLYGMDELAGHGEVVCMKVVRMFDKLCGCVFVCLLRFQSIYIYII